MGGVVFLILITFSTSVREFLSLTFERKKHLFPFDKELSAVPTVVRTPKTCGRLRGPETSVVGSQDVKLSRGCDGPRSRLGLPTFETGTPTGVSRSVFVAQGSGGCTDRLHRRLPGW